MSNSTKKVKKTAIPKTVRRAVWEKSFGRNAGSGKCQCCYKTEITVWDFEAGHIHAQVYGGPNTVSNLLPICKTCNLSMGSRHLREFQKTHGFNKKNKKNGIFEVLVDFGATTIKHMFR